MSGDVPRGMWGPRGQPLGQPRIVHISLESPPQSDAGSQDEEVRDEEEES